MPPNTVTSFSSIDKKTKVKDIRHSTKGTELNAMEPEYKSKWSDSRTQALAASQYIPGTSC